MVKIKLLDGSGVMDFRHLVEDVDRHGNVRLYVRKAGRSKVRLHSVPGSDEFREEYRAALTGTTLNQQPRRRAPAASGSFRWLVERYYAAAVFTSLQGTTQRVRKKILDRICERHGDKPFALMETRHVRELRDEQSDRPEAANAIIKALRQVFKLAVADELCSRNPVGDNPYLRVATDGFHTWSVEEVAQFEARHPIGTMPRLALGLMLFAGVRRSDAVLLGPQHIKDGWLRFVPFKNRKKKPQQLELPVLPELREIISATPSGNLTFLVTQFGRPFTSAGFGNWFRKRCDEAGLPVCTAHGLRKAGATIAANNGATEHQLMAVYGWESPKQAALYTRKANRKRLAGQGMHLVVPDQMANETVPLSDVIASGGTKSARK